jgi:hypothetical protein
VREDSSTGSQYNPASNSSKATTNRSFGKAISKLKGPKTLAQVAKQEEECRSRVGQCTDAYRSLLVGAQSIRREYFNSQLPRILRVSLALPSNKRLIPLIPSELTQSLQTCISR